MKDPFRHFMVFTHCQEGRVYEPHRHEWFEIIYFVRGSSKVLVDGKYYTATQNNLVIYFPGVVHEEWYHTGDCCVVTLWVPKECLRGMPVLPGKNRIPPVLCLPWPNRFGYLFEQFALEYAHKDRWSRALISAYLEQFILLLRRALTYRLPFSCSASGQDNSRRFSHVMDMIHQSALRTMTLHDMARAAGLSESHFSHLFKRHIKMPPRQYAIHVKMAEAMTLLSTTGKPAADIAGALGYGNPSYFFRLFKAKCGCTPLDFRKKAKKCTDFRRIVH